MTRFARFAFIFLLVLAGAAPRSPAVRAQNRIEKEIEQKGGELEDLKRQAEAKRKQAREVQEKEKGVLAGIERADEALNATRSYIRHLEDRQGAVAGDIEDMGSRLSRSQQLLHRRRELLVQRLRYNYMYGRVRPVEVILSASSFPELLQRGAFLNRIVHQDQRLISEVNHRRTEVEAKLSWLQMKQEELARLQEEKEKEERQHAALKEERERKLGVLKSQRTEHEKAAKELDAAAARLESVLADLERRRREAVKGQDAVLAELDRKDFGANRGRLPWPAQGSILTGFGRQEHPKYKTVTLSKGIDIAAPAGAPVRVVGDGVVDLVQWLSGYGQTIIVNHGNGFYTVYAHLASSAVKQGQRVAPGQTLGTVGESGSLKGPCLHFELRAGGAPQDPASWLR